MQYVYKRPRGHFKQQGFTLIEIMITVVVVAILVSIAVPNYTESIKRGRRSEGRSALMQAAQWMERAATATGSYPLTLPTSLSTTNGGYYTVAMTATATTYTLTATPVGAQASDICGNFTLTQTGERGRSGSGLTVTDCWNK